MSSERAVDLPGGWAQGFGRARPRVRLQAWLPCLVVVLLAFAAAAAGVLAPFAPAKAHLADALTSPQWLGGRYVLGTDQLGRDVLSRLLFGLRTSLEVGAGAVVISAIVGIPLGLLAGYAGSWTDWVIMRVVDFQMSIPGILLL